MNKLLRTFKGYNPVQTGFSLDEETADSSKSKLYNYCKQCGDELRDSPPPQSQKVGLLKWSIQGGWLMSGVLTVLLLVLITMNNQTFAARCFASTTSYTPLVGRVPDDLHETVRNGSIRWPSPYRGDPSPAIDKAWDRISMFRPLNVQLTEEQYNKIGKSPETAAKNPPQFGGGFFVQPEFSHQLHCLNLLRKSTHFKYSYYMKHDPDFRDKEATFKVHVDHCVEMLRQYIMCHADVGLVTAHWIEQRGRPWPDFNTKQTCRNFDGIWQWVVDNQMPEGTPMIPMKPPGAKALSSPP